MNTFLKATVASALALAAGSAFALTPAQLQIANTNGNLVTLYVSGATATDNAFENLFKLDDNTFRVCAANTLDIYYFKSSSGSIQQRALTCTAAFTGTGITSGVTQLALLKESQGGSANGIVNPATGAALQFINLVGTGNNLTASCGTTTTTGNPTLPNGSSTYNTRDCGYVAATQTQSTVVRANVAPQAGISDVDPATFVGTGGVTAANEQALTRKRTSVAVTFNPIVSVPLFTALQRAYGWVGANAGEDTSTLDHVPSIPSSVLRAIFNGNSVLGADQISINGKHLDEQLNGFAGGDIYLCRRGETSGTMTSFKLNFLGQGCNKNAAANNVFVAPDNASCLTAGCAWNPTTFGEDFVFAGAGSGDVRSCMDYQSSQGRLAIGIASTEAKPNTTNQRFRYVKVDGAEPSLKAVMEGRYSFFTENTFNDRFPGTSVSGSQTLWDKLFGSIGNSTALSELNRSWRSSVALTLSPDDGSADTGILDVASASNATAIGNLFSDGAISGTEVRATPINSQTRTSVNGVANNCNQPYQVFR